MEPPSNRAFAEAFAPLMQVKQSGTERPATPADILELLEPRFVLKSPLGRYLGDEGRGWLDGHRGALVLNHIDDARRARKIALTEYGLRVIIVRLRRRGTLGIEAYRLRPDIDARADAGGTLSLFLSQPEGMALLAAMTGGAERSGTA
jgi:hypothetical protein